MGECPLLSAALADRVSRSFQVDKSKPVYTRTCGWFIYKVFRSANLFSSHPSSSYLLTDSECRPSHQYTSSTKETSSGAGEPNSLPFFLLLRLLPSFGVVRPSELQSLARESALTLGKDIAYVDVVCGDLISARSGGQKRHAWSGL